MEIDFPQYRKYKNNMTYFKVLSYTLFEEIRKVGKRWERETFEAKILPDRNLIRDMLFDYKDNWDIISKEEYESACAKV